MYPHLPFQLSWLIFLYVFYTAEMKKWYVVYEGSVSGVYEHWKDCFKQANKFKGNNYKSYKSEAEAEARYLNYRQGQERKNHRMKSNFIVIPFLLIVINILLYVIVVIR